VVSGFSDEIAKLKVSLSHDWLTGMRGGEKVLELLCREFPDAPLFSLLHNRSAVSSEINSHQVTTSGLQNIPGIMRYYRYFLPFFPHAVQSFKLPPSDLVISTSHCVAKGIRPPAGAKHLCYCFTPMRYAWIFYDEYFGGNPAKKMILSPALRALRKWDLQASERVDRFVAISEHVRRRIEECYGRQADIVYPPVDTEWYTPSKDAPRDFDLIVSALVPYKRIDLAVRAYNHLGYPLKVVGAGTEYDGLRRMAGANIEFLGFLPDEKIRDLYRHCRCLVFPGEEDFGIVPVEVQACGRPVVAYRRGGLMETVRENVSGVFFDEQTEESLLDAVEICASQQWDTAAIRKNAEQFSTANFLDSLSDSIKHCLNL